MQALIRVVSVAYLAFLTLLLWTADPSRLIGGEVSWLLRSLLPVAHLVSFFVLAVLALSARWPAPAWGIVLVLSLYGGMTELVQGFTPHRRPEWGDWFQDVAGIAVGAALCWGGALLAGAWAARRRPAAELAGPPDGTDDWETS
jgi:hypothetical protein